MTEVIQFPSPSSEIEIFRTEEGERGREEEEAVEEIERKQRERDGDQLSILTLLVTAFRRSMVGCSVTVSSGSNKDLCNMEIGVPTNVRHVNHVTFDRFNGFLGLPVEFELEVPRRAPSASATVFGVSTESMQLSYDSRGNSVPTILLMMQRHLYAQGGLEAEGIFRITAGNSQEEFVREQLNKGVIPEGIDVHCLAGLIKAWFRELPTGVLDSLSSEQVMQSQTEEECAQLARQLPSIEAALLDWAINLMADVVQLEHMNKMNAHNIAMVFAPNMTQMSDPLTALIYAVQVINFLKNLIMRMLKEREDCVVASSSSHLKPADDNGDLSSSQPAFQDVNDESSEENGDDNFYVAEEPPLESSHESDKFYAAEEPPLGSQHKNDKSCAAEGPPVESPNDKFYAAEEPPLESPQENDKFCAAEEPSREATRDESSTSSGTQGFLTSIENIPGKSWSLIRNCPCKVISQVNILEKSFTRKRAGFRTKTCKIRISQTNNFIIKRGSKKSSEQTTHSAPAHLEKVKSTGMRGRINPTTEMLESWR